MEKNHKSDHEHNVKDHKHVKEHHQNDHGKTEHKAKLVGHSHHHNHHHNTGIRILNKSTVTLMVVAVLLVLFNQVQINSVSAMLGTGLVSMSSSSSTPLLSRGGDLSEVDVDSLQSTAQTISAVFPELHNTATADDVMTIMFPTGTPEYGEDLGVTYDDPVTSLATLANMYRGLKAEVEKNDPEAFQRFVNLAANPKGVSCEYCCGVGPVGIDDKGNSRCGCKHNPAALSLALYLSAYSDYTDAEILRETMKWKTLFFPKNMIELGSSIAGGDTAVLEHLPGMVGGC